VPALVIDKQAPELPSRSDLEENWRDSSRVTGAESSRVAATSAIHALSQHLDPARYVRSVGLEPFEWQIEATNPSSNRLLLLAARQSGKSTIVGGPALGQAKHFPRSLALIICPAQDQSKELVKKIEAYMRFDPELPRLRFDNVFEKEFVNGSRIVALPGSERSIRGYSGPRTILIDEAARVEDATFAAAGPMMIGANTRLTLLSTAQGKRGFFWRAWNSTDGEWTKIMVTVGWWVTDGGELVPAPSIEEIKSRYAPPGAKVWYSPRHTKEECQSQLDLNGIWWYRQELQCVFHDDAAGVFSMEAFRAALDPELAPMIIGSGNGNGSAVDASVTELKV
jgi:hypothetical protein